MLVHNDGLCMPVFDSLVGQSIQDVADVINETKPVKEAKKYGEGIEDSFDEKINLERVPKLPQTHPKQYNGARHLT